MKIGSPPRAGVSGPRGGDPFSFHSIYMQQHPYLLLLSLFLLKAMSVLRRGPSFRLRKACETRPRAIKPTGAAQVPCGRHERSPFMEIQLKGLPLRLEVNMPAEGTNLHSREGKRRLSKKRLCHIFEKASVNRAQGLTACGRELCEAFPQAERTSRPRPGGPSPPIEASPEKGDIPAARDAYIGSNKR